jgi:hypothetical protein
MSENENSHDEDTFGEGTAAEDVATEGAASQTAVADDVATEGAAPQTAAEDVATEGAASETDAPDTASAEDEGQDAKEADDAQTTGAQTAGSQTTGAQTDDAQTTGAQTDDAKTAQAESSSDGSDDPFYKAGAAAADALNQVGDFAASVFKGVNDLAGDTVKASFEGIAAGFQAAAQTVGGMVDDLVENARERNRENEDFAGRKKSVQLILDSASLRLSASDLAEKAGGKPVPAEDTLGAIAGPGCYIALTFEREPHDLASIDRPRGGYVGTSRDMRHDALAHVSGAGNADIYADVKYGKSVYFYFYPTASAAMDARARHFVSELGPLVTYTAPTVNAAAHGYADVEFEVVEEAETPNASEEADNAPQGKAEGPAE